MSEDQVEDLLGVCKKLLIAGAMCLVAAVVIALIDFKLKSDIVKAADAWREELRDAGPGQPPASWRPARGGPASPGGHVPDSAVRPRAADGLGSNAPAPQGDDEEHHAAPIVSADERFRPPHRGSVNGA